MSEPSKILPSRAVTVEPYSEDELHNIAREIASKLVLKVVDTFSHLSQQDSQIAALQTYWGPMFYYAIATPREAETFAGTALGEAMQTLPKPRLFNVSVVVPPGALPGHFQQIDTVLRRVAKIFGANHTLQTTMQVWNPQTNRPEVRKNTLYTGAATSGLTMVTFQWDAGSDKEVRGDGGG